MTPLPVNPRRGNGVDRAGRRRILAACHATLAALCMATAPAAMPCQQQDDAVPVEAQGSRQRRVQTGRQGRSAPSPSRSGALKELSVGRLFFEGYYREYLAKDLDGAAEAYELLTAGEPSKYHLQALTELLEIYRDQFRVDDVLRVLRSIDKKKYPKIDPEKLAKVIQQIETVRADYEAQFAAARKLYESEMAKIKRRRSRPEQNQNNRTLKELDDLRKKLLKNVLNLRGDEAQGGFLVPGDVTRFLHSARIERNRRIASLREMIEAQHAELSRLTKAEGKDSPQVAQVRKKIVQLRQQLKRVSAGPVQVPATIAQIQYLAKQEQQARRDGRPGVVRHYRQRIRRLKGLLPRGTWIPPATREQVARFVNRVLPNVIKRLEVTDKPERVRYARNVQRRMTQHLERGRWKRVAAELQLRRGRIPLPSWLTRMLAQETQAQQGRRPRNGRPGPRRKAGERK